MSRNPSVPERTDPAWETVRSGARLHLRVLGRVDLEADDEPVIPLVRRRKPFAIFAYLALDESGKFFQRDHLCGVFWPEKSQRRARASLRQALFLIRKNVPGVLDQRGSEEVRLTPGSVTSDYRQLLAAVDEGRWSEARQLNGGDPFLGFHLPGADDFEMWIDRLGADLRTARAKIPNREVAPAERSHAAVVGSAHDGDSSGGASTKPLASTEPPDGPPPTSRRRYGALLGATAVVISAWFLASVAAPRVPAPEASIQSANVEARAAYLRAMSLIGIEGADEARVDRWSAAEEHLRAAVAADPDFAAAWARLAHLRFRAFWLGGDPSSEGVEEGRAALERARRLDPKGPVTRLASAYHAYHIDRDWHAAADSARTLMPALPDDPDVSLLWAMAERRRGNFAESARIQTERLSAHPEELAIHGPELHATLRRMGDHGAADEILARLEEYRGPSGCWTWYDRTSTEYGAGPRLDSLVARCRREAPGQYSTRPLGFWHEYRMRRPVAALANVDSVEAWARARGIENPEWMNQQWAPFPLDLWRGAAYLQIGDTVRAREAYGRHIPRLEALRDEMPDLSLRRRFLAIAYAGARRSEDAMAEANAARAIALRTGDMWAEIPDVDEDLLGVFVLAGEFDRAFEVLGRMRDGEVPGLLPLLRTDPGLDPLREDPRFQELLVEMEEKGSY